MDHFHSNDLEYVYDPFDDGFSSEEEPQPKNGFEDVESDLEDDFELSKAKTDTSALEARNGKDIQGIPWERLKLSRDEYRETRLKQYRNYESLSRSRDDLEKDCLQVEKGNTFYNFQFNTRLVKSTIVHFQECYLSLFQPFKQGGSYI